MLLHKIPACIMLPNYFRTLSQRQTADWQATHAEGVGGVLTPFVILKVISPFL